MHTPRTTLYIHLFICEPTLLDENACSLRFSKIDSEKTRPQGTIYISPEQERRGKG